MRIPIRVGVRSRLPPRRQIPTLVLPRFLPVPASFLLQLLGWLSSPEGLARWLAALVSRLVHDWGLGNLECAAACARCRKIGGGGGGVGGVAGGGVCVGGAS